VMQYYCNLRSDKKEAEDVGLDSGSPFDAAKGEQGWMGWN